MSICFSDSWLLVLLKLVPILPLKWIHIISHTADAGPVISALHSLQSISPLCCLHRCPRDPVLIRSLHRGDSLQHSYRTIHKNKAQTVSDTNLLRLHPTKVFPQQMHLGLNMLPESSCSRRPFVQISIKSSARSDDDLVGYFERAHKGIICSLQ